MIARMSGNCESRQAVMRSIQWQGVLREDDNLTMARHTERLMKLTNDSYLILIGTKNFTERYYRDKLGWVKVSARKRKFRMTAEQVLNHVLPALTATRGDSRTGARYPSWARALPISSIATAIATANCCSRLMRDSSLGICDRCGRSAHHSSRWPRS